MDKLKNTTNKTGNPDLKDKRKSKSKKIKQKSKKQKKKNLAGFSFVSTLTIAVVAAYLKIHIVGIPTIDALAFAINVIMTFRLYKKKKLRMKDKNEDNNYLAHS